MNDNRVITEYGYVPKPSRWERARDFALRLLGKRHTAAEQQEAVQRFVDEARSFPPVVAYNYFEYTDQP